MYGVPDGWLDANLELNVWLFCRLAMTPAYPIAHMNEHESLSASHL